MNWRIRNGWLLIGKNAMATVHFEKRDAWVGVYWDKSRDGTLSVYVCLVPFFPIHLSIFQDRSS